MIYSDTLPNQEGHYWKKERTGFEAVRKVFYDHDGGFPYLGRVAKTRIMEVPRVQWAGPIPHPALAPEVPKW